MSETHLQTRIRRKVLTAYPGSWMVKIHGGPMQAAGIPDLIGCVEGLFVALEVKLPDGKHPVTPLQRHTLLEIQRAGGIGAVVRSPSEALDIIEDAFGASELEQAARAVLDEVRSERTCCAECDAAGKEPWWTDAEQRLAAVVYRTR